MPSRATILQSIIEEQARLDVINGSSKPGLAGKTKRILNNHSFSIVRTDNSDEVFGRNTLYVLEPQKYPATVHKLELFYPDLEIKLEEYPHRPTGDMVLVVV
jgi:LytR cell envelope-related transcriptional attenuator